MQLHCHKEVHPQHALYYVMQELAYNTLPDQNKLLLGIKAANWMSTRGDASIGKVGCKRAGPVRRLVSPPGGT